MRLKNKFIGLIVFLLGSLSVIGQPTKYSAGDKPMSRILIVFDASESMAEFGRVDQNIP